MNRYGILVYRWFYHMEELSNNTRRISDVFVCPSKWSKTDQASCFDAEAFNLVGYVENTDWVVCCRMTEQKRFRYFGGADCKKDDIDECQSFECTEAVDEVKTAVDEAKAEHDLLAGFVWSRPCVLLCQVSLLASLLPELMCIQSALHRLLSSRPCQA